MMLFPYQGRLGVQKSRSDNVAMSSLSQRKGTKTERRFSRVVWEFVLVGVLLVHISLLGFFFTMAGSAAGAIGESDTALIDSIKRHSTERVLARDHNKSDTPVVVEMEGHHLRRRERSPRNIVRSKNGSASSASDTKRSGSSDKPSIIFCGVVRNVQGSHLRNHIPKLVALAKAMSGDGNFHILIYENDSNAGTDTRHTLQELLNDKDYATFFYEDNVNRGTRTEKLARARNKVLQVVEERFAADFEYLVMTDMDGVCGGSDKSKSYDPEIFQYALQHADEWDAVSFRFFPYWDLYALRQPEWMSQNLVLDKHNANQVKSAFDMTKIFDKHPRKAFLPVTSAFMMLSIYKMESILGSRYNGFNADGAPDCEHVAFHKNMIEKHEARIRILPMVYCVGDEGYYPLQEQLAM